MKWNPYSQNGPEHFLDKKRKVQREEQKREQAKKDPRFEGKPGKPKISPEILDIATTLSKRNHASRIQIADTFFSEIGDRDAHLEYVESKERSYSKDPEDEQIKAFSDAVEYLVASCINKADWMGETWHAQLASTYDDLHNGIDIILENTHDAIETRGPLGLSLDVTFTEDPAYISAKFQKHKQRQLDQGKQAQLLYYKPIGADTTDQSTIQRRPHFIPHVVVGFSFKLASKLLHAFGKEENSKNISRVYGLVILYQIEQQLIAFREYSIALRRKAERERQSKLATLFATAVKRYDAAYGKIKLALDEQHNAMGGDPIRGREWVLENIIKGKGTSEDAGDPVSRLILQHAESIKKHA